MSALSNPLIPAVLFSGPGFFAKVIKFDLRARRRPGDGICARFAGSSGEQSSMLYVDTNVKLRVILPESRLTSLPEDPGARVRKGCQLTAHVSAVSVPDPEKYEVPMT